MEHNLKDANTELWKIITSGYKNLIQWIVALSTGVLIFGVNFYSINLGPWRSFLTTGLAMLVFSILLGVFYVKLSLDSSGYNLELNKRLETLKYWKVFPNKEVYIEGDSTEKVAQIVHVWDKAVKHSKFKLKIINRLLPILFNMTFTLFFYGTVIVVVTKFYNL